MMSLISPNDRFNHNVERTAERAADRVAELSKPISGSDRGVPKKSARNFLLCIADSQTGRNNLEKPVTVTDDSNKKVVH